MGRVAWPSCKFDALVLQVLFGVELAYVAEAGVVQHGDYAASRVPTGVFYAGRQVDCTGTAQQQPLILNQVQA